MPSGEFESGFAEEVERALTRRRGAGKPEIWIYFKQVDPEQAQDAGEQLRRVLAFREKLERERELLFAEFETSEEWRQRLYQDLLRHVLQLHEREHQEELSEVVASV